LEEDFDMPQPLSRVRPNAIVAATPESIALRPTLAPLVADIIARWAYIEANIGTILSYILQTEAAPVTAMLHAINSASAQIAMILAAGSAKLYDPELEAFEAVMKIAGTAAKKRHPIAHHVWAYTVDLPDALLLIEPEAYTEMFVELQEFRQMTAIDGRWTVLEADKERTMVYRENDFRQIIEEFKSVSKSTTLLINYLDPTNAARDQIHHLLASEPLMDAALQSLRKNPLRPPKPRPPAPQTGSGSM
jgi:hypothetical protein